MAQTVVAKFGGTSMAEPSNILRVADILQSNADRKICVVSAPGKTTTCPKMTDLLISNQIEACTTRATHLVEMLKLSRSAMNVISVKLFDLNQYQSQTALISFGEWLSAYLLSEVTKWRLIDACDVIFFNGDVVHVQTPWQKNERVIVPGFYGYDTQAQTIKLFPRGGSDITASYIAQQVKADLCENWTDVAGVYNKDPNEFSDAVPYRNLSYSKLLEVANGGAQVFHPEAIEPLRKSKIPLCIKNTFAPDEYGTMVT
jgi:homoserine O-succinyltransferase